MLLASSFVRNQEQLPSFTENSRLAPEEFRLGSFVTRRQAPYFSSLGGVLRTPTDWATEVLRFCSKAAAWSVCAKYTRTGKGRISLSWARPFPCYRAGESWRLSMRRVAPAGGSRGPHRFSKRAARLSACPARPTIPACAANRLQNLKPPSKGLLCCSWLASSAPSFQRMDPPAGAA